MRDLEQIRAFFARDKYASEATGIEILEAERGHSRVALKIDDRHRNALGAVMGAVYFTMADFAFAVATNCDEQLPPTVSLNSNIQFIRGAKEGIMYATADAVKEKGKTNVYVVEITDEENHVLAHITTCGYVVQGSKQEGV